MPQPSLTSDIASSCSAGACKRGKRSDAIEHPLVSAKSEDALFPALNELVAAGPRGSIACAASVWPDPPSTRGPPWHACASQSRSSALDHVTSPQATCLPVAADSARRAAAEGTHTCGYSIAGGRLDVGAIRAITQRLTHRMNR